MAPRKRTQTANNKKNPKMPKLEAFLLDFDDEVHTVVERLKEKTNNLLKDADNLYKTALIKLPMAVRKMNWIEYCNIEKPKSPVDDSKVKEDAAEVELAIAQNHPIPKFSAKESNPNSLSEDENIVKLKTTVKKQKKAQRKAPSTSNKSRALSVAKRRSSRKPLITPARSLMDSSISSATPLITPRFDPRLPKTPGQRVAHHRERVFSMSVNGSPISAGGDDIVISVPLGNGECLQLLASEINSVDLSQLDEKAQRCIRNLQTRLTTLCGPSK